MTYAAHPKVPELPPASGPPLLLLDRALQWRLGAVALLVVVALGWSDWHDWQRHTAEALPSTAALAAQLLTDDVASRARAFNRTELGVTLAPLERLGQRAPLCVRVADIHDRPLADGCLPRIEDGDTWAGALARWLAGGAPESWRIALSLNLPEGTKAGMVEVRPNWALEGRMLWQRWVWLTAAAAALMLSLWGVSRLVARALAPANLVLSALDRLAAGDLQARLPPMRLRELDHISQRFNHMAEHHGEVHRAQQELAQHLLQARESERRRLARDLHDEMGQSLTALQAEAAAMSLMTSHTLPEAAASAQAMGRTTAHLLDGLQRVLADLRPEALDRFGLTVALQSLVTPPRHRADGSRLIARLHMPAHWDALPPDHDGHVYRIVQEALTNTLRHSSASQAEVRLQRDRHGLQLSVTDNGSGRPALPAPGHGLLGMNERIQALGGRLAWEHPPQGGLCLNVWLPLAEDGSR